MTREEVLAAIRECAAELKRHPKLEDLRKMKQLLPWKIRARFGSLTEALRAAGLKPKGTGHPLTADAMLLDWAKVARKLKQLPSLSLYQPRGQYTPQSFYARFGGWSEVPHCFARLVRRRNIAGQWKDVLALVVKKNRLTAAMKRRVDPPRQMADRPVYGPPLFCPGVAHEPVNELGVIYLFGAVAQKLGFIMLRMQTGFPDCEAMREMQHGHWQRVRIEFEFTSRGFKKHHHEKNGCDMIVCWIHDWAECPKELEVLELRKAVVSI
ncbi:MAG TPA: hypothetical protein VKW06_20885 [Candidatus Angelobacter sp.]|nr:hypothetical protein [Candidatus Angelobacter sp.]